MASKTVGVGSTPTARAMRGSNSEVEYCVEAATAAGSIPAFHTTGRISNIGSGNSLQNYFNISSILIAASNGDDARAAGNDCKS
jgi:hypothetical protein